MAEFLQDYWIFLVIALVVAVAAAAWFLFRSRRTKVDLESYADDDAPAKRNQALIDAMPVVHVAPTRPVTKPPEGAAPPAPPAPEDGNDLTRIKGVGPKLHQQLREMGITSFAQIAAWDDAEIDRVDAQLGRFQGRIKRDDWRTQASLLAADDIAGYEEKFGKL